VNIIPIVLVTLAQATFSPETNSEASDQPGLSEILSKEITAVQFMPGMNTVEFQELVKKFTLYRKKKITKHDKDRLLQLCDQFDSCRYMDKLKPDPIVYGETQAKRKGLRRMSASTAKKIMDKGEFAKLDYIRQLDLNRAMDRFPTLESMYNVVNAVMEPNSCRSAEFMVSLAIRVEDFFPEKDARSLAIKIHNRIAQCVDHDSATAERSLYRVSLLHYWNGDCTQAEKPLLDLTARKDSDYRSRAFYWLARCAKAAGKKVAFEEYRERLYKANPISYYLLLLNQGELEQWSKIHKSEKDSDIWVRSKSAPELNSGIHLVEGLLSVGENDYAREILRSMERKTLAAEPQVRLYISALAHHLDETIIQFKLLDSVFREDAANISTRTLKMFFPLKQFSVVWEHRLTVDPYLVAALIRQESGFNEKARSRVGALGLMQLMPNTARILSHSRVSKRKLFEPETNVRIGVQYFKNLLTRFDGDAELALAGYNAGPQRVESWVKRFPMDDRMLFLELIPFAETRKYVSLISRNYYWYLSLYGVKDGSAFTEMNRSLASSRQKDFN